MKLTRITIAVTDMPAMVRFYDALFDVGFAPVTAYGTTLYRGTLAGVDVLLCPNDVARVDARQNRKQLTFTVDDLDALAVRAERAGGSIVNRSAEALGVSDPDGNTLEFVVSG